MNLTGSIARLKTGTYTATRRTPTARVNGVAQAPTNTKFSFVASIVPASGRQLQRLPEGMRQSDAIAIFTATELHVSETSRLPDLLTYKTKTYEVQNVKHWEDSGAFYEAIAIKVGA